MQKLNMQNRTIAQLAVLAACVTVGLVSSIRAYQRGSVADAVAAVVIWLVITPLFGYWWERRLAREPRSSQLRRKLFVAVLCSLVIASSTLLAAFHARHIAEAFLSVLLWAILLPFWLLWSFRQRVDRT